MYHRRHFSFHSWISCARENYLSLVREDNWPCITFEALSIREKLSLFSLFFALAVPPGRYSSSGKMNCAGRRKEIGKGTRKRYKGRNGPRKRTRDVCRAYVCMCVCICVCTYIYNIYIHIHTLVYVRARARARICVRVQAGYIGFLWEPRDRPVSHYIVTRITYSVYLICEERSIKYCINI